MILPTQPVVEIEETLNVKAPVMESEELPSSVVLLVEDEAPVRAFASRALKLKGFTVLEAGSGKRGGGS